MDNKIKVLFMSDYGDTGFGTVGKELCARLASMEIFDVHYLGWHAQPSDGAEAARNGFTLHCTNFWDASDQFAAKSFNPYIEQLQPQVVLTLGDPWMVDHVQNCPYRKSFTWLAYMPIDRDVLRKSWRAMMKDPDCLVTFSQFGYDVATESIPFLTARNILHGIDKQTFKPWYPAGTDEDTPLEQVMSERKRITLGDQFKDKFVVGWVGRNQIRKGLPRTIRAFKAFNCKTWTERLNVGITDDDGNRNEMTAEEFCKDQQCFRCDICPAFQQREEVEDAVLYLHTTRGDSPDGQDRPGIGHLVDELADRHDLHGRVAMTPKLTALKGVPRGALAQIMNAFDVHCFLTMSEGFGLPIAESLGCGVPTLATDYSSCSELVAGGGGVAIRPNDFVTFNMWENEWACADIGHAADEMTRIHDDPEHAASMRKEAAENSYVPDWNQVALQFRRLILESVGQAES